MVRRAFPRGRIVRAQSLAGGLRNANVKVTLDATSEPIVLPVYEHDASLCRKEADLIRLVGGSVPVPEVILAEPAGDGLRPFMLQRYVEGPTLRGLVGRLRGGRGNGALGGPDAGRDRFDHCRGAGMPPSWPHGHGPSPVGRRPDATLRGPVSRIGDAAETGPDRAARNDADGDFVPRRRPADLRRAADETSLVHDAFGRRNLIVAKRPAAGSQRRARLGVRGLRFPARDVGHFLRLRAKRPPSGRAGFPGRLSRGRWPLARNRAGARIPVVTARTTGVTVSSLKGTEDTIKTGGSPVVHGRRSG